MNQLEGPPSQFKGEVYIGARALYVPNLIWFGYIPVGRRGIISSFKLFVPAVATCRGRERGHHPELEPRKAFPLKGFKTGQCTYSLSFSGIAGLGRPSSTGISDQTFLFWTSSKISHLLELSFSGISGPYKPFTSCTTHYGKSFLLSWTSHPGRQCIWRQFTCFIHRTIDPRSPRSQGNKNQTKNPRENEKFPCYKKDFVKLQYA